MTRLDGVTMTIRSFGRAGLAGYAWDQQACDLLPATGEVRLAAMREALQILRKTTGADLGYDLRAWREFLIAHGAEFGYTHSYAYQPDRAVLAALEDAGVAEALLRLGSE